MIKQTHTSFLHTHHAHLTHTPCTHYIHAHITYMHTHTHTSHSCEVDLKSLEPEVTHDMKLPLKGADRMDAGAIHVVHVVTGTSVEEKVDKDGREKPSSLKSGLRDIDMSEIRRRYVSE